MFSLGVHFGGTREGPDRYVSKVCNAGIISFGYSVEVLVEDICEKAIRKSC